MDMRGYPWISLRVHGYPWIPWISMGLKYVTGTVYFHSRNAEKFLGETKNSFCLNTTVKKEPEIQITDLGGNGQIRYLRILLFLC